MAASLIANEQLLLEAIALLELIYPGLEVTRVDLTFRSATTASPLKELIAGAIFLAYQEKLTTEVPALIERLGIPIPEDIRTIVTVMVMLVAVYGVAKAAELFGPKKSPAGLPAPAPSTSISENYGQILLVSGDIMGVDPATITDALATRYRGAKARPLAKKALEFIRPAKQEAGAAITGAGVEVTAETVAAAPSQWDVDATDDEEIQEPHTGQSVVIHATDLDSNETGWAGHLPGLYEKRLRMRLYPTINTDDLYGHREVRADIILVSRLTLAGDYQPYLFHVVKLY